MKALKTPLILFTIITISLFSLFNCEQTTNPTSQQNNTISDNTSLKKSTIPGMLISPESGEDIFSNSIDFIWEEFDGSAEGYDYQLVVVGESGIVHKGNYTVHTNETVPGSKFESSKSYTWSVRVRDYNSHEFVGVSETNTFTYWGSIHAPSGFNVSPMLHNNLNQTVSISWNASTHPFVTGYEIFRKEFYLSRGQLRYTGYVKVRTSTPSTESSWSDESPAWGTGPHQGIGYLYKIRSIDSINNTTSNFSGVKQCYLEEYDDILP